MTLNFAKTGIEKKSLKKRESFSSIHADKAAILFFLDGDLTLGMNGNELNIHAGEMFFLSAGDTYFIQINGDLDLIYFPFDLYCSISEGVNMQNLLSSMPNENSLNTGLPYCLPFRKSIRQFLALMEEYLNDHLYTEEIYKIKISELIVLLRSLYAPHELALFFSSVVGNDLVFMEMVSSNYHRFNTVESLAQYTCYSTSGFTKKFHRVFHESPYQWMLRKKAQKILSDIKLSGKTFKEISMEYGFSSQSHFYLFCKKQYNASPSFIRKKHDFKYEMA